MALEQRKLTAILCADVEGYSRLMGSDEVTTVQTLKAYREIFARVISDHGGRVVNTPGTKTPQAVSVDVFPFENLSGSDAIIISSSWLSKGR
jgi:class 3 adenylate cyclase